jgi:UDP-hydrolysing UDP-N-acetyl-D-glucosamine 2-epimerase
MPRRIAVVLVDRANYGRLKPVMEIMRDEPGVDMQIVCTGTMLLDRFGTAVDVVEADGFQVDERIYIELEGSVPATMVKSMGLAVIELGNAFARLDPEFVLVIGDRYEALSAAIAAAYQNICLIHLQGGEVTGSIDESTRHAITKLAHYHFPATRRAARYVVQMGEPEENVFWIGCPSADVVDQTVRSKPFARNAAFLDRLGVGPHIDIERRFLLSLFHPVTTEYQSAEQQMMKLLAALKRLDEQVILIWPNIDAGADGISQAIRRFREVNRDVRLHAYKNFEPERYIPLLKMAACLVGNSSSFVRDASFLGTPVVLVGSRQDGRELSESVIKVEPDQDAILRAVTHQLKNGGYPASSIYGEPGASRKIVDQILHLERFAQKTLVYRD